MSVSSQIRPKFGQGLGRNSVCVRPLFSRFRLGPGEAATQTSTFYPSSNIQTIPRQLPPMLPPPMEDVNPMAAAAMVKLKKERIAESDKRAARRENMKQ